MPAEHSRVLLISDLHLGDERPDITEAFLNFLRDLAPAADALYILGDLFNFWIGDDHDTPLHRQVAAALANLAENGTPVYLLHGNRDFLLGADFAAACGATLIHEPYILEDVTQRILLLHGDTLCTRDQDYMRFRAMVRDQEWQRDFLARPLAERLAFAENARRQSKSMSGNKPEDIMDVSDEAVLAVMSEQGVKTLIHGHTHRPAQHAVLIDDQPARRLVLGDWDEGGWYIEVDNTGQRLIKL